MRDGDSSKMVFHVDSGSPLSWRNEPYYSQLKRLARNGLEHNGIITINIGKHVLVILPKEDIDFGICDIDDKISIHKSWNGLDWDVEVYKEPQNAPIE
jgi:hypothetical protein